MKNQTTVTDNHEQMKTKLNLMKLKPGLRDC